MHAHPLSPCYHHVQSRSVGSPYSCIPRISSLPYMYSVVEAKGSERNLSPSVADRYRTGQHLQHSVSTHTQVASYEIYRESAKLNMLPHTAFESFFLFLPNPRRILAMYSTIQTISCVETHIMRTKKARACLHCSISEQEPNPSSSAQIKGTVHVIFDLRCFS